MDIAAIINAAIVNTINEAIKPLQERIAQLEAQLETKLTPSTPTETDHVAFVNHLDNQEWFWDKINNYIERNLPTEMPEAWLEKVKEMADASAEEAVNDHEQNYDHDDYDRVAQQVEDGMELDEDMVRDAVKDVLSGASLRIDI